MGKSKSKRKSRKRSKKVRKKVSSTGLKNLKLSGFDFRKPVGPMSVRNTGHLRQHHLTPENAHRINSDQKIVFEMNTGPNWVRFTETPLHLYYYFKEIFKPNGAQAVDTEFVVNSATKVGPDDTGKLAFRYFIDPAVGGCALIEDMKLYLDNQEIPVSRHFRRDQIYIQMFNRVFALPEERESVGIPKKGWIAHTQDINEDNAIDDPALQMGKDLVTCDKNEVPTTDATSRHIECSLDGFFPLAPGKNFAASKLTGQTPNNKLFFPPFTKIRIELMLRKEVVSFIQLINVSMIDYFKLANNANTMTGDNIDEKKVCGKMNLVVKKSYLTYETFKMDTNKDFPKYTSGTIIYPLDLYTSSFWTITKGSSTYACNFMLKANVTHVYLAFLRDHQYDLNTTIKKNLSAFTVFPRNLDRIRFELNGEMLAFDDDLKELDITSSVSQRLWYEYLKNRKLVTEPLSSFFPGSDDERSLHQLFFLDLTTHKIQDMDLLKVSVNFKGNLNENSYKLFLVTCRPGSITRKQSHSGPIWELNEVRGVKKKSKSSKSSA